MAVRTQTQLGTDISGNVKSGGSPSKTTAANLRTVFTNLVDTMFSYFVAKETGSRLLTTEEANKIAAIAPPPPSGVKWTIAPAEKPAVTSDDITQSHQETAAEITVGSTPVTIPAKQFVYALAAAGKERTDTVYARYEPITGQVAGFYQVSGNEVNEGFSSIAPSVPTGALFVRYVTVTDNAASTTTTPTPITLDPTVTQNSTNGVKSSGIWSWVAGLFIPKTALVATTGTDATKVIHQQGMTGILSSTRYGSVLFGTGTGEKTLQYFGFKGAKVAVSEFLILGNGSINDFQFKLYKANVLFGTYPTYADLNVAMAALTATEQNAGYYFVAQYLGAASAVLVNFKILTI